MSSRPLLGEYVPPDDTLELKRKVGRLEGDLDAARGRVRVLERQLDESQRPLKMLRKELSGLYNALRAVFGELDTAGIVEDAVTRAAASAPKSAVWDHWMNQLGGNRAAVLKALLEHGEMSRVQLRVVSAVPDGSLNSVTSELHKLGLINRGGGKYSLKEL